MFYFFFLHVLYCVAFFKYYSKCINFLPHIWNKSLMSKSLTLGKNPSVLSLFLRKRIDAYLQNGYLGETRFCRWPEHLNKYKFNLAVKNLVKFCYLKIFFAAIIFIAWFFFLCVYSFCNLFSYYKFWGQEGVVYFLYSVALVNPTVPNSAIATINWIFITIELYFCGKTLWNYGKLMQLSNI